MKTFLLIMIFSSNYSASAGSSTLQAEFTSYESCEMVRKHIVSSLKETFVGIRSQGCFQK